MSDFHGLGAKFEGFQSSTSGSSSSPFVHASDTSSHTSLSLASNVCLPPLTTHDTTRSHHHMGNFEAFVEELQLAAKRAFPNSAYSRYSEIQVLLIRWDEDELEVEWELNELRRVFRDLYGFTTDKFLIPTHNSHRKLTSKVLSFVEEHENEDTLLIVYYGGHGAINKARQSTWSCKGDKSYATVDWSAIQTLFETAKCDVLLLLDCCSAASAASWNDRPANIKETIAACGFETWAPLPGAQSFTHTLLEVLEEWASQLPFSAAMLHSEILTRLKHAPPDRSPQGRLTESRKTPVYIVATSDPRTASITLGRLFEEETGSIASSKVVPGSPHGNLSERLQADSYVSTEERIQTLMSVGPKGQRVVPHVLLKIALESDQVFDAASCARWIKQFPLLAMHASIESVYQSYSTLLLLSVPVVLWNLLSEHPATQFVGNEDFRFEVHDSPMCYHLRVSVWGVQMLELIGELHVDLCELVSRGELPELGTRQTLRCNGTTTGLIHIKLTYMNASEDEEQQTTATQASAEERLRQRQELERQQNDEGQAQAHQMDFQVW
ncbi:hypothetical protein FGRMN_6071 [Fusarium graminum]|nr:hypothetical protein FGRMN_6071 [Fusarium graminum]